MIKAQELQEDEPLYIADEGREEFFEKLEKECEAIRAEQKDDKEYLREY